MGYSPWGREKLDMTERLSSQPEKQVHALCLCRLSGEIFVSVSSRKVNAD